MVFSAGNITSKIPSYVRCSRFLPSLVSQRRTSGGSRPTAREKPNLFVFRLRLTRSGRDGTHSFSLFEIHSVPAMWPGWALVFWPVLGLDIVRPTCVLPFFSGPEIITRGPYIVDHARLAKHLLQGSLSESLMTVRRKLSSTQVRHLYSFHLFLLPTEGEGVFCRFVRGLTQPHDHACFWRHVPL